MAQWLACWAHNPKVRGSKPRSAMCAVGNCARAKRHPLPLVKCDSCSAFMPRGRPHIGEIRYRNHITKTCVAKHYSTNGARNTAARAPRIFPSISFPAPRPSNRENHAFIQIPFEAITYDMPKLLPCIAKHAEAAHKKK